MVLVIIVTDCFKQTLVYALIFIHCWSYFLHYIMTHVHDVTVCYLVSDDRRIQLYQRPLSSIQTLKICDLNSLCTSHFTIFRTVIFVVVRRLL